MARKCFITGKKTKAGNNRSHAMNASKRTWGANLQKLSASSLTANLKKCMYLPGL